MTYFSFFTDHPADSFHFLRSSIAQLDDVVERVRNLSRFAGPLAGQANGEVSFFESHERLKQQLRIQWLGCQGLCSHWFLPEFVYESGERWSTQFGRRAAWARCCRNRITRSTQPGDWLGIF